MRYLIALMLLWTTTFANASQAFNAELPMMCGDKENLLKGLRQKYEEEIIFITDDKNSKGHKLAHSLWVNPYTKTWSFVVVNVEIGQLCIIASGDNFSLLPPGKSI